MATFDFNHILLNPRLQYLFTQLEEERKKLLASLKSTDPEILVHAPSGKWSIQEILAHLISAEKLSILYVRKKILGIEQESNTGLWEEFKMLGLQISQRFPFKFKAPRIVVERTLKYGTMDELWADWQASREDLRMLLEKFDDLQIRKKVYRHVYAGQLNIQHALQFLREHILHHTPQIRDLLNHSR